MQLMVMMVVKTIILEEKNSLLLWSRLGMLMDDMLDANDNANALRGD